MASHIYKKLLLRHCFINRYIKPFTVGDSSLWRQQFKVGEVHEKGRPCHVTLGHGAPESCYHTRAGRSGSVHLHTVTQTGKPLAGAGDMNINERQDCCKNPRFQVNMLDTFLGCRLGQVSCPGPGFGSCNSN